ncbi:hypothetical protein IM40_02210 [Candidatus Paracaedimonas acanthamoebae]|nr:hypothetical protein IM40_02210 [Candidatus Paracaedimonas acanthamoebae]
MLDNYPFERSQNLFDTLLEDYIEHPSIFRPFDNCRMFALAQQLKDDRVDQYVLSVYVAAFKKETNLLSSKRTGLINCMANSSIPYLEDKAVQLFLDYLPENLKREMRDHQLADTLTRGSDFAFCDLFSTKSVTTFDTMLNARFKYDIWTFESWYGLDRASKVIARNYQTVIKWLQSSPDQSACIEQAKKKIEYLESIFKFEEKDIESDTKIMKFSDENRLSYREFCNSVKTIRELVQKFKNTL